MTTLKRKKDTEMLIGGLKITDLWDNPNPGMILVVLSIKENQHEN